MAHEKDEAEDLESRKQILPDAPGETLAEDLESRKQILPDAPGETLITAAVKFLQNAKVRESSLSQRKLFLEKKGLSKEQIDIAVTRSEQDAALQPQYVKPHLETTHQCCSPAPVSAVSKVRDYVGFTLVVGGVGYAIYYLLRRFLGEVLFGPSEEQKQMMAVTKSVTQLEESITEMLRGLRDMQGQLQQQQLNLTQIITNMGSPEVARIQDTRDLNEVKEAVNSLKGLLLNRRQFPPTPVTAPVLPAWQLSKGDIASESSSSAISITTNVSTTSDSTAQDTDSTEDVTLCKDDKVVQNAKTESDLLVENSNNEKLSSTTNGIKETASNELLET